MLRKFLIATTVIVSILILLTNLTTSTEAASVKTLTTLAATTKTTTIRPNISATVFELTKTSGVNSFLNNAAEETTTSLLPLQPPLNVTSTTLASFILNQNHQKKQQQQLYLRQQRQQRRHLQDVEEIKKEQQQQPQLLKQLLNDHVNTNKEIKKKNLDSAFVTFKSAIDVINSEPSSTHAYIPFDLDYNDPTEEKAAAQQSKSRQSTINEVLTNLFPKGFSDIFRFSYAGEEQTTTTISTTSTPIIMRRSTPTPFKPMSASNKLKSTPQNNTFITVSTTVTREMRREISPGHTEIVVEKIITDPASGAKSNEDFKDGSNSISKDELLRINRAAQEASVLPSLLIKPSFNATNHTNGSQSHEPIVILNENNNNDDFVEAPEDDNQIAETQDVVHQVIQPPPAESSNFQVSPTHQYNVHIIHDNSLKNNGDSTLVNEPLQQELLHTGKSSPSYQAFVQQSKYLQNSLQEAPSRKFLKNFQNPILSESNNPAPITKGNFHYEQDGQENHIQAVAPAAQLQYVQYQQAAQPQAEALQTQVELDKQHLSDKDIYQIGTDSEQGEDEAEKQQDLHSTHDNLVFVTINTPVAKPMPQAVKFVQVYENQEPHMIPAQPIKSPHEFVSDAMGYSTHSQPLVDHQAEQTETNAKPSEGAGYTFVEVQKSINIHNKLITEKDGRLIEEHETIYPEQKYTNQQPQIQLQIHQQEQGSKSPQAEYISLSKNPIHVEQEEEQYESAASVREEQHAPNPAQTLEEFGPIQQSNLVQESHIIETPQQQQQQHEVQHETYDNNNYNEEELNEPQHHQQEVQVFAVVPEQHREEVQIQHQLEQQQQQQQPQQLVEQEQQLTGEILPSQAAPIVQIPYALPTQETYYQSSQNPVMLQEVVEKHIPVPYGVPEPVGIPVHIQHFIDRPFPIETIVEKPVPYPVEKVVERVVEKHVPVEVEKIVEKPVQVVVKKYIDRPVAIPIKIPVALHLPAPQLGPPGYGPVNSLYASTFANGLDHASTWPQPVSAGTFTRIPQNILKAYYVKMLKKLVPQMQQAYKSAHIGKGVPKITQKPYAKPKYKISDILYDLKPPPPHAKVGSTSWDVGARYQYDYNTLPLDLSASSSIAVGKTMERPGHGYKQNFDEFQRWRNGHNLKRSPDFGRNLHMEYGFKPPLVPSVEIDDKGVPLKAIADLTNGKQE